MAAEQKARTVYENLMDLTDDEDILAPLSFLREREVVHYERFKALYEEYAKKTPAYMNQELWLFAIFYLVIIVTNICLTTTIYI